MMVERCSSRLRLGGRFGLAVLLLMTGACAERRAEEADRDTTTIGTAGSVDTAARPEGSKFGRPDAPAGVSETISQPLYYLLREESRFSTFVEAADAADLAETLMTGGPYTVFAPTNEAFGRMELSVQDLLGEENVDLLRDVLLYHVSNGITPASDLTSTPLRSLAGYDIRVEESDTGLSVNGARITESDLSASNGVVHVIDEVLLPEMEEGDL